VASPAFTVTELGAVSVELVLESDTAVAAGAARESVTVHEVEPFTPMLAGTQTSDVTPSDASRGTSADTPIPFSVAVMVAT